MTGTKQTDGPGPGSGIASRPHEELLRVLLSDPARAHALLRDHLPNDIVEILADTPPVQFDWSFVDETRRDRQTDFLFEVEVKSGGDRLHLCALSSQFPPP